MSKPQTLKEIQQQILSGTLDCVSLVKGYLEAAHASAHLNAYVEVFEEEALAIASQLDAKIKANQDDVGELFGLVISIKDVLAYKDHKVTGASKILENFTSLYSATAIDRLIKEDAIIIGRVNCDQFGMGSTNENSCYGPVKNGLDEQRVPGGSSGGSAVSVQMDTCLISLGTDTGGSVRQPAAFCGLVGLKPTYGRISRHGLLAYASSFDQIGILGKNVEDVAIVLEIMAGADNYDSTVSHRPVDSYSKELDFDSTLKIAYFKSALDHKSIDAEIQEKTNALINDLKAKGHEIVGLDFELLDYLIPAYYVLTTAEASSNLSRYDGIRYGYRDTNAKNLLETYTKSRTAGFSKEVKRRIMLGTFVLSAGYYDAYYGKAQKVRRLIREQTKAIFKDYDFILMPSSPEVAGKIGALKDDPVAMYLADIYTVQANMAGIPAINIPIGMHSNGMPIGVQFMADDFEEAKLLSFSKYLMAHV